MKIGDKFINLNKDTFELVSNSPTWQTIKAKNLGTGRIHRFRFYSSSGEYIMDHTSNITLGTPQNN